MVVELPWLRGGGGGGDGGMGERISEREACGVGGVFCRPLLAAPLLVTTTLTPKHTSLHSLQVDAERSQVTSGTSDAQQAAAEAATKLQELERRAAGLAATTATLAKQLEGLLKDKHGLEQRRAALELDVEEARAKVYQGEGVGSPWGRGVMRLQQPNAGRSGWTC